MKIIAEISHKLKKQKQKKPTEQPHYFTSGHIPKELSFIVWKYLYPHIIDASLTTPKNCHQPGDVCQQMTDNKNVAWT